MPTESERDFLIQRAILSPTVARSLNCASSILRPRRPTLGRTEKFDTNRFVLIGAVSRNVPIPRSSGSSAPDRKRKKNQVGNQKAECLHTNFRARIRFPTWPLLNLRRVSARPNLQAAGSLLNTGAVNLTVLKTAGLCSKKGADW